MAKKKSSAKKSASNEDVDADEIFRSHAAKIGIPVDSTTFDVENMKATWVGTGDKCSEVLSSIEKKLIANSFEKLDIPKSVPDDPIVEALEKLELKPESRREGVFKKCSGTWTATVMYEHNLGEDSKEDSAVVLFCIEESNS